ncbi:hypothetical protein M409DRAFT_53102 [Zasmidium cellare ATCC 36951]|uniref:Uncharacterized protein n=1 Tax=Zasmidium cellare ATCC 36951 TaxID=1080233 RepID=A0A6A6CSG6_ZASCE|nr:uncharacterized protein M409DRAFT_53102 [Zasmidium cellare ATCC 36951]KAF2168416.1 hypothetical protein M409DRAFT_53102 [Zasmidium cellare ATCC 36951]
MPNSTGATLVAAPPLRSHLAQRHRSFFFLYASSLKSFCPTVSLLVLMPMALLLFGASLSNAPMLLRLPLRVFDAALPNAANAASFNDLLRYSSRSEGPFAVRCRRLILDCVSKRSLSTSSTEGMDLDHRFGINDVSVREQLQISQF